MSIRKGNDIIASKPTIDSAVTSGSPNAVSGGGVYTALQSKQNNLVAGSNITISGSTISAKDTTYTAGENITIESTGADNYTLLEYIQSNGTQYIDTGVSGLDSGNWMIYIKWMLVSAPTTSYSYVIGAYNGETYNTYRIITKQTSASGYYVNGNSSAGSGSVSADNYAANVIHEAYIRNGSVTVDSTTYSTPTQGTTIPSSVHLFLLGNASVGRTSSRIYESWAKQNGIEKYHYYPAMRNSDNAIGMYDTVGQRFVSATSGTFAAGPVKSDGYIIRGKNWSVSDLTDTLITSATTGDVLQYDGTDWVNTDILSNKVNIDADNFTDVGTTALSKLGYFGERYEQLKMLGSGTSYVAPANGWFTLEGIIANQTGNRLYLILRSNDDYIAVNKSAVMAMGALANYRRYVSIPARQGDTVFATYESTSTNPDFSLRFYYAEGNTDYTPPEHTLVEYIEGTSNTQYIRTNVKPISNMHIYCKMKFNESTSSYIAFGSRAVTYDGVQFNVSFANQRIITDWFGGSDSTNRWALNTTIAQDDVIEFEIENSVATITRNGTVVGTHTFTPTGTVSRELYLTGLNNNGAPAAPVGTGCLCAFKIWDGNGNLIMDMQPAKDSSNVACLYNTVMQTLYYNSGTGSYTAGPEIN